MIEKIDINEILINGFDFKKMSYNIVEEDMDYFNQDKSIFKFTINEGDGKSADYKIIIRPTYIIGGKLKRPEIMLVEKTTYDKGKEIRERLFRAAERGILKKHVDDIFNHVIKCGGENFMGREMLEIIIRDYNLFLEKGVKQVDDPDYARSNSSPFINDDDFEYLGENEIVQ